MPENHNFLRFCFRLFQNHGSFYGSTIFSSVLPSRTVKQTKQISDDDDDKILTYMKFCSVKFIIISGFYEHLINPQEH